MSVREYMAELFQKNKMAAAAILNCYFVTVDNPRSLLHGPNIVLKFHVNRVTTVGDSGGSRGGDEGDASPPTGTSVAYFT